MSPAMSDLGSEYAWVLLVGYYVTDGSHVYVRKLKFCNLGAWLGTGGRIENENAKIMYI